MRDNPFSLYSFADSQTPLNKYGLAQVWLTPLETLDAIKPFPPFDIRNTSQKEFIAYWLRFAYRYRDEGLAIGIPLLKALKDSASQRMLWALLSSASPESQCWYLSDKLALEYRQRIKPFRDALLKTEAARLTMICKAALAMFRDKSILSCLPEIDRSAALALSALLWLTEIKGRSTDHYRPSSSFHVPFAASDTERVTVFHFLDRVYRQKASTSSFFGYLRPDQDSPSPYADPFMAFAIQQSAQLDRDDSSIKANLMQRKKSLLYALATRLDALSAFFVDVLCGETHPRDLFDRLCSFWPERAFASLAEIEKHLRNEARL